MPGLFSCAAEIPIPHKTIAASRAGVYTLLQNACWGLDPKPRKGTASDALFHRPHGAATHPADAFKYERYTFSQPVNPFVYQRPRERVVAPPVEHLARQRKRPLPGDWGRPPTSRFYRFSRRRKNRKLQSVYHSALLATIENNKMGSTSLSNKAATYQPNKKWFTVRIFQSIPYL